MRVIIFEDEPILADRLERLLKTIEPDINVMAKLDSVKSGLKWFRNNPEPDLVFQDIHLADGSCFEIYRNIEIGCPVIFITAYDKYAIEAFKVHSIDYLLKPLKKQDLEEALRKYHRIRPEPAMSGQLAALAGMLQPEQYVHRFMVRYGEKIKSVDISEIAYFFTDQGAHFFRTFDNHTYPLDQSLEQLMTNLDPKRFFRINRQYIISIDAIKEMYSYSKSRVKIELTPAADHETISSTERSGDFKRWLGGRMPE